MPNSCIVPKCKTNYKSSKVKLSIFKVPNDEIVRKKWEDAIPGINKLNLRHYVKNTFPKNEYDESSLMLNIIPIVFLLFILFLLLLYFYYLLSPVYKEHSSISTPQTALPINTSLPH